MNVQIKKLLEKALRLPPEARGALAGQLIDSLDKDIDPDAEDAWEVEISKRLSRPMMTILTTLTAGSMALLLYVIFGLDDWLGILAFKYQYSAFCMLVAGIVGAVWLAKSRRIAVAVGLTAFTLLMSPYFVSEPSSRILRGVLIDVQVGTQGDVVEQMVKNAYNESGYAMPRITKSGNRIHVSQFTQEPGDCTAAIFHLDSGMVVNGEFSRD